METCPYSHEAYRMDIAAKAEITCLAIRVCPTSTARADLCFSCVLLGDTALALLSLLVMGQRNGRAFQGQDTCSWQHVTNVTLHSACAAGQLEERSQYPFLLSNRHRWASMLSSTFSISSADAWGQENRTGFCGKLDNHFRESAAAVHAFASTVDDRSFSACLGSNSIQMTGRVCQFAARTRTPGRIDRLLQPASLLLRPGSHGLCQSCTA